MISMLEAEKWVMPWALCCTILLPPKCYFTSKGRGGSKAEGRFGLPASPWCCAVTCFHGHTLPSSPPAAFLFFCLELSHFRAMLLNHSQSSMFQSCTWKLAPMTYAILLPSSTTFMGASGLCWSIRIVSMDEGNIDSLLPTMSLIH